MKTIKTLIFVSLIGLTTTQLVFASWWNPFTWGWFKRSVPTQQAQQVTPTPVVQKKEVQTASTTEVVTGNISAWKTHINSQHSFEIKLPPYWEGYQTNIQKNQEGVEIIRFDLPYTFNGKKTFYEGAIKFLVYPKSVWVSERGISANKIAERNNYIYAYIIGQDLGGNVDLEKAAKDMEKIISTFKFMDSGR